jgi:hypothetical protein
MGTVHHLPMYGQQPPENVPLAGGGEPPHDGGMNARIDRLDHVVERIEADISSIKVSIGRVETQMTHVATKAWIMASVIIVLAGILVSVFGGLAWISQQYLAPLLRSIPK